MPRGRHRARIPAILMCAHLWMDVRPGRERALIEAERNIRPNVYVYVWLFFLICTHHATVPPCVERCTRVALCPALVRRPWCRATSCVLTVVFRRYKYSCLCVIIRHDNLGSAECAPARCVPSHRCVSIRASRYPRVSGTCSRGRLDALNRLSPLP